MGAYRHVMLAVDFSDEALQVGTRARDIARCNGSRLSLIHVVEQVNISAGYELMPILPELPDDAMLREAVDALNRLAAKLDVKDAQKWTVKAVSTREGIVQAAKEHDVDLIVVGSHGRHGLALLLGSTANAVLHGAPCDVLAVRIQA
jgi:universal stress protein A